MEKVEKEYVYKTEIESREPFIRDLKVNETFGWQLVSENKSIKAKTYRREKSEMHDGELQRLEKRIDTLIDSVTKDERKLKNSTKVLSGIFGAISALVMGGGMSFIMAFELTQLNMILGVVLGIVGMIGCVINYPIYKKIELKKLSKLQPRIIESKEKIVNILEQVKLLENK